MLVAKVDNVALPDGALLIGGAPNTQLPGGIDGLPASAWYGEALTGGLSIDDPDGAYDFDGWHTLTIDETACTGKTRIWNGYLQGRRVHRGPYKSGASRVWDVDIVEMNILFALMVFRAASAKRPYETDLARAQFIIESQPMAFTPTVDNGRANFTDNPINFDESDLVTRFPIEALNEFAGIAGKNFYNYWDHDEEENSFHYDLTGVGPSSTLSISNDIADTSSTCYYPFLDGELDSGPEWTVTGILLAYRGAYAYGIRQATIDSLSPSVFSPVEFQRDFMYSSERVGRAATAANLIQSMLAQRAVDIDTIKCSIRVPNTDVNLIEQGDIVNVKMTHLPGYEEGVDLPVIRRNVVPTPGRVDMYDLHLELSGAALPSGPGGGDPGPFPQQPPCDIDNVDKVQDDYGATSESPPGTYHGTWSSTPTAGNMLVASFLSQTNALVPGDLPGWTWQTAAHVVAVGGQAKLVTIWTKIAEAGEPTDVAIDFGALTGQLFQFQLQEWSGVDSVEAVIEDEDESGGAGAHISVFPTAGTLGVIITSFAFDGPTDGTTDGGLVIDSQTGANPPSWIMGHLLVEDALTTPPASAGPTGYFLEANATSGFHKGAAVAMMLTCTGGSEGSTCPAAGTPNHRPEIVTMTGADGTTLCPFADGTLHVFVDATEQTATLVSTDGVTGEFTLGFDPTPTEVVTVEYLGR